MTHVALSPESGLSLLALVLFPRAQHAIDQVAIGQQLKSETIFYGNLTLIFLF
jgi:hypothetical protein